MTAQLRVSVGQFSDAGAKNANQDAHVARIPDDAELDSKGVAVALADAISSSDVAHIASETAVRSFLQDYYCTSAAWSARPTAGAARITSRRRSCGSNPFPLRHAGNTSSAPRNYPFRRRSRPGA